MTVRLSLVERLLLPNACVACGHLVAQDDPDALVCALCRWRLKPLVGGCPRCAQPMPPVGPCRFCAWWPPELSWGRSGTWLDAEARAIVHQLKYGGYTALADVAAEVITRAVPRPAAGILVPIPLAPRRARLRGYNQATVLAQALAARWRLPIETRWLGRSRDVRSQTALTPEQRARNVAGAFTARGRSESAPPVIIDDVLTTGATLCAATLALVRVGCRDIRAVTFARALPFERRAAPASG